MYFENINHRWFYRTFLPIAGICCLAITGFLIATTIVLALIPLYVPQQHATVYTVPDGIIFCFPYDLKWINCYVIFSNLDADRFQLGFRSTGAEGDDEVAGSVDNLSEVSFIPSKWMVHISFLMIIFSLNLHWVLMMMSMLKTLSFKVQPRLTVVNGDDDDVICERRIEFICCCCWCVSCLFI